MVLMLLIVFVHQTPSSVSAQDSDFLQTLGQTVAQLKDMIRLVSTFSDLLGGGDRLSASAVEDCLDLLDLSVEETTWAISATKEFSKRAAASAVVRHQHDLRSWLSAALSNQDTCNQGLSRTNILLKTLIVEGMGAVTDLISNGLSGIPGEYYGGEVRGRKLGGVVENGYPGWVEEMDRRLLHEASRDYINVDVVVAADGSGDFTTISSAMKSVPNKSEKRIVIYVKSGVYKENVYVHKDKWNIMLIGDGPGSTVITGNRNFVDGWTTYRSATFAVDGRRFIARDIKFENTAGPKKHQAVALRSNSDLSVFYRCEMEGYQDTLYPHSLRQFYRECIIKGTVDFIFGNGAVVFQNCKILARKPLPHQKNTITAQGRSDSNQNTGFIIQYSNITADEELADEVNSSTETYIGRPWRKYSKTVVMQSYLGPVIHPKGWIEWDGKNSFLSTLYYAEYKNFGPGSKLENRVDWPGFHVINSKREVEKYTVMQMIDGESWLPETGVKYADIPT